MNSQVFKYLSTCSTKPNDIDRLIVSAFLAKNRIDAVKNEFLQSFIIKEKDTEEYGSLQNFISILNKESKELGTEELIELFEFVISPADRVINGAIYTPINIRNFITDQVFLVKKNSLLNPKIVDIACGCGGFLFNASKELKKQAKKNYSEIFKNHIFGLDIQSYSITRTKLLLTILAVTEGEDKKEFHFNLFEGDALTFKWEDYLTNFTGFDIVVGNPPYVCTRNLSDETKLSLENWEVSKSGNPDLYIPFFQIGIENLSKNGILGFITMNSFFKSLNGRSLRDYFKRKSIKFKIIDFGTQQIFKSKNTYTCICLIENTSQNFIKYYRCESKELPKEEKMFSKVYYSKLDSKTGWNLQDNEIISKIETTGVPFGKLYKTRHGIATLKNDIYIFRPIKEDKNYYYLQNGDVFQIEKDICKDIVNSNKLNKDVNLKSLQEKIIFPYDDSEKVKLFDEKFIKEKFPKAYNYLQSKRQILAERDKGKGEYGNWYAFGRTQSLEKIKNKLFFPKMSDKILTCTINSDDNLLFYNGQAIVGHSEKEMIVIKKIMESRLFWYYIKTTSKPYSSNFYSLDGNYIRNFGVCNLTSDEINFVINEPDRSILNTFFENKYGISLKPEN